MSPRAANQCRSIRSRSPALPFNLVASSLLISFHRPVPSINRPVQFLLSSNRPPSRMSAMDAICPATQDYIPVNTIRATEAGYFVRATFEQSIFHNVFIYTVTHRRCIKETTAKNSWIYDLSGK